MLVTVYHHYFQIFQDGSFLWNYWGQLHNWDHAFDRSTPGPFFSSTNHKSFVSSQKVFISVFLLSFSLLFELDSNISKIRWIYPRYICVPGITTFSSSGSSNVQQHEGHDESDGYQDAHDDHGQPLPDRP